MYKKILIATDGSPTAGKAAQRGIEIARKLGSQVILLSVGDPEVAGPVVEQAARALGDGVTITPRSMQGQPADVILTVADEEDVDLIVVGNKGMTDAKRFLLGNVPNQISHHAPCNVLIVKTT